MNEQRNRKIDEVFVYLIKRRKDIIRRRVEKLE